MSEEESLKTLHISTAPHWDDYTLVDSGNGVKLERFGGYYIIRPESQAIWKPEMSLEEWHNCAHAIFTSKGDTDGGWRILKQMSKQWRINFRDISVLGKLTPFRHVGIFPEQASHWDWMSRLVGDASEPIRVLNLFGYTGVATLLLARRGAEVTHVDASTTAISWAHENQTLSRLDGAPIRWIVDDVVKFLKREVRRGVRYDGIIVDAPKFGRGTKGEVWKAREALPIVFELCQSLVNVHPLFFFVTSYATRISAVTLYNMLLDVMRPYGGEIEAGESAIEQENKKKILSIAAFARWKKSGGI